MSTETAAPAGSADVSSATPFESSLGELMGDYSGGDASPEPDDTDAAGTTPAEPVAGTEPETDGEPAAAGDGPDGTTSEGTTPDATATATEDDPFKDSTPATYMVNGQTVTSEDIRVFKEGGAVIRPESLPNVLSKLAERDQLAEKYSTRDREYQTLAKASEWSDGTKTYSGPEGAVELRVGNALLLAENNLLVQEVIQCEDLHAAGFLTTKMVPDGNGGTREAVVFRPDAIRSLQIQNENAQLKASQAIRSHFAGVMAEASRPQPAPIDFPKAADALVSDLSKAANLDASVLTAADRALLAKQLPFHIRDGMASLEWQELVKDRIQDRTQQKANSQTLVTSTTDATKKAQANMAAAARGVKPSTRPVAPAKPVAPQTQRAENEGDLYDAMERAGAAAMRTAR